MQGLSPPPSPGPNLDAPRPNRVKRSRVLSPDLDVDLDCFFRSKRFMTEAVTKEMEDVLISDPPLTTSPSRTSTLTRYADPQLQTTGPLTLAGPALFRLLALRAWNLKPQCLDHTILSSWPLTPLTRTFVP